MDELNIQEIEKKLNSEFEAGERLVFWYDADASFEGSVERLNIKDVHILRLTDRNSFRVKMLIEHEDTNGKYLIYAPFSKPDVVHNHLEDTMLYSKQFYADRLSLIAAEIGLPDRFRVTFEKRAAFFGIGQKNTKESVKRIIEFIKRAGEVDLPSAESDMIDLLALCVITKTRNVTVEDLIYSVFASGDIEKQEIIHEFEKVGIADAFWELCGHHFGYEESKPSLMGLLLSLFAVHLCKEFTDDAPVSWKLFLQDSVKSKTTNISVLLDNMMNNVIYQDTFDKVSVIAENGLDVKKTLGKMNLENILSCTTFKYIDELLIKWIIGRELTEDKTAAITGMNISEICDMRKRLHFGSYYSAAYDALEAGYEILSVVGFTPEEELSELTSRYVRTNYRVDTNYRKFIFSLDKLEVSSWFDELKVLIQNIYQTEFLEKIVFSWNTAFVKNGMHHIMPFQSDFYRDKVTKIKEKTVVIISDALRYEAAKELAERLEEDQNCEVQMDTMMGTLPSYTAVGMAALLPHEELSMTEDKEHNVLLDGKACSTTEQRRRILQRKNQKSALETFEKIREMSTKELKAFTVGKEVIYVYHNRIDATGETARTENSVFAATAEAIDEIFGIIKTFSKSGNVYRFLVTADHGYIYSRKKLEETDKLEHEAGKAAFVDRRFIIDDVDFSVEGIFSVPLKTALANKTLKRYIMFAKGMSVFKCGGGMNYVHGGSSPQELIIPSLFVKTQRGVVAIDDVKLNLITDVRKITNLKVKIDVFQEQAVTDTIKSTVYRLKFEADDGEVISNEVLLDANNKDEKPGNRIYTICFDIKRKYYSSNRKYFLKIVNDKTGEESMSRQVLMDLPFMGDLGF